MAISGMRSNMVDNAVAQPFIQTRRRQELRREDAHAKFCCNPFALGTTASGLLSIIPAAG
jgi:hypothetical protein